MLITGRNELFRPAIQEINQDSNRLIVVTGIPGSGKDFLVESFLRDHNSNNDCITIYNFGSLLFSKIEERLKHKKLGSRDDIRTMLTQAEISIFVNEIIVEILSDLPALVNTHVVYKQNELLTINISSFKKMNPLTFVYVWADPGQIIDWRKDTKRVRDLESVDDLAYHQAIAYEATYQLAKYLGSRFITVHNQAENVQETIATFKQEIEKLEK